MKNFRPANASMARMRRIAMPVLVLAVAIGCCRDRNSAAGAEIPALPPPATQSANAPVAAVWFDVGYPPPPKPGEHGMGSIAPAEPRPKLSPACAHFLEVWAESRRLIESVVPESNGKPLTEKLDPAVFDVARAPRP